MAIGHGGSELSLTYIRYSSEDSLGLHLNEYHLVACTAEGRRLDPRTIDVN